MNHFTLVNNKLFHPDKCLSCLLAKEPGGQPQDCSIAAVVESQGEYGFFLYRCEKVPPLSSEHLSLHRAFHIDSSFKFTLASQSLEANQQTAAIPIRVSTPSDEVLVELPGGDVTALFLGEMKKAMKIHSKNSAFGICATFHWMEKYTGRVESDTSNPFLDLDFGKDRLKLNDWPFNQILQPNVGKTCPVVKDSTVARSPSLQDLLDAGNSFKAPLSDLEQSMQFSKDQGFPELPDGDISTDVSSGRESIIKLVMKDKEEDYTDIKYYRVFCGTWNTNGQAASQPVKEWLCPPEDDTPPDIYALGFQELDLSKNAYIFSESPREEEWYLRVRQALNPKAKYKKVKLVRLVGMMLIVFIRQELTEHVTEVCTGQVGTGLLGMMGNKGGVAVRLKLHDTTLCFVNSHLAAHTEEYERRNQDFRDINSRMNFANKDPPLTISDHDTVYWIGDLNYRLSDIDDDHCKQLIKEGRLDELMANDQLCRQITLKKVFLDYLEGRITFIPTYKYDTGSDQWDTSEKCRTPAWCDRILWRGSNIRQLKYRSHMTLQISDHKPVSSLFDMGVRLINRGRYRAVYEDVMKRLDRRENEFLPQLSLDTTEVNFEEVKFVEPQTKMVTLTNTGQVRVQFEFINKPGDQQFCRPWLTIVPSRGIISVGCKASVQLDVYVKKETAAALNSGKERMEDILVLHLEGGKDIFITVCGTYAPSCFGSPIEQLVYMSRPIRDIHKETGVAMAADRTVKPMDIPKELWRLADHLYRDPSGKDDLFQQPGHHSEIQLIRDCLDTGSPTTIPGSIHSVAEAFMLFLDSCPEPVVPFSSYQRSLESCSNFLLCKQVLTEIPVAHRNVFKYVCAFLRHMMENASPEARSQEPSLAMSTAKLFGGLLLRAPPAPGEGASGGRQAARAPPAKRAPREDERKRACFVFHFLVNEYDE